MIFKTYKSLTKKQKEEWDYRFKDYQPLFNMNGAVWAVLVICAFVTMSLILSFTIITDTTGKLGSLMYTSMQLTWFMASLLQACAIIILVCMLFELFNIIINFWIQIKWMKNNNIPIKESMRPDWMIRN